MLNVTVVRSKWLRGKGGMVSALLNTCGLMCCLGFVEKTAGRSDVNIMGRLSPADVARHLRETMPTLPGLVQVLMDAEDPFFRNTNYCADLMSVNDAPDLADATREQQLIRLGKKAGIAFTFVD